MGELQASMLSAEFEAWKSFYRLYPFDDLHRYHRPAALVSVSMAGGEIDDAIEFLQPQPERDLTAHEQAMKLMGMK